MRRIPLLLALAVAGGCGSEKGPPPLFGGFASADATAVLVGPATCPVPGLASPVGASGVALIFSSVNGACGFAQSTTNLCGSKANASLVVALAANGVVGGSAPALETGTYPYLAAVPTGAFKASLGTAAQFGPFPTCSALPGSPLDVNGGSITLTTVTSTRVAGSVNLHFPDGSVYEAPMDMGVCAASVDLCALVSPLGCVSPICVP